MSQSIGVFGLGYAGTELPPVSLFGKSRSWCGCQSGQSRGDGLRSKPICRPQVKEMIAQCRQACLLRTTTDPVAAVMQTEISFLCVGTSSLRNGKLDLGHVEPVCREIGEALKEKGSFQLVVLRSTVCARHGRKHRRSGENVIPRIGGVKKEELQKHLRAGPHRDRPGELGEGPPACGQFQLRGHLLVESYWTCRAAATLLWPITQRRSPMRLSCSCGTERFAASMSKPPSNSQLSTTGRALCDGLSRYSRPP